MGWQLLNSYSTPFLLPLLHLRNLTINRFLTLLQVETLVEVLPHGKDTFMWN